MSERHSLSKTMPSASKAVAGYKKSIKTGSSRRCGRGTGPLNSDLPSRLRPAYRISIFVLLWGFPNSAGDALPFCIHIEVVRVKLAYAAFVARLISQPKKEPLVCVEDRPD